MEKKKIKPTHFFFMGFQDTENLNVCIQSTIFNRKSPLTPAPVSTPPWIVIIQVTYYFCAAQSILLFLGCSASLKPVVHLSLCLETLVSWFPWLPTLLVFLLLRFSSTLVSISSTWPPFVVFLGAPSWGLSSVSAVWPPGFQRHLHAKVSDIS